MNEELKFEITNGIGLITLNRPESYNTMSNAIIEGLRAAYRQCDENDDVRVVVVTGAGNAFCAGADMSGGASTFDGAAHKELINSCPLSMQAWQIRKPVIAAINGAAAGGGAGLSGRPGHRPQ